MNYSTENVTEEYTDSTELKCGEVSFNNIPFYLDYFTV